MPANYPAAYDVRNCFTMKNRPKRYVWGVYAVGAPNTILYWAKRKKRAATIAALMSSPLKHVDA